MEISETWTDSCSEVGLVARNGDLNQLRYFIAQGKPVDVPDNLGWRPLHEASASRNPESVKCMEELLKQQSTDVNCRTHDFGETPLFLACKYGNQPHSIEAVQMLVNSGANVNIPDNKDETPVMVALRSGFTSIVHTLLNTRQVDPNIGDFQGWTPLHEAAEKGQTALVRELLESWARTDLKDVRGVSPLDVAAGAGNAECLKLLLEKAKERQQLLAQTDPVWINPLLTTIEKGFTECARVIASCSLNLDFEHAMLNAVMQKRDRALKGLVQMVGADVLTRGYLLPGEGRNIASLFKVNPVFVAVKFQSRACLRAMLEAGIPADSLYYYENRMLEHRPFFYETPLSLSLRMNDIESAKLLLDSGANSNSYRDRDIFPPLYSAILYGTSIEIDLLLEYGAEMTSPELFYVAFTVLENLCYILRRGADPRSCFSTHPLILRDGFFLIKNQQKILRISKMLLEFLGHESQVYDYFSTQAERCLTRFQDGYDSESWCRLLDSIRFPSSLAFLCRLSLRRHLLRLHGTGVNLCYLISSLQVPQSLISYLNHEDLLCLK